MWIYSPNLSVGGRGVRKETRWNEKEEALVENYIRKRRKPSGTRNSDVLQMLCNSWNGLTLSSGKFCTVALLFLSCKILIY